MAFQNEAARRRRRIARRVYGYMRELGLLSNLRQVSRSTGIDMETLRNLRTATPKLETLERISKYVEQHARSECATRVRRLASMGLHTSLPARPKS